MRSALLLLSLISTAFAITCYSGVGNSSSHPSYIVPCNNPSNSYCFTSTQPNGTTLYGCDPGVCQNNDISSGQCKTNGYGIKYCCCSTTLCNNGKPTLCNSGKPTGYSYIFAVIAVSVSFVFA